MAFVRPSGGARHDADFIRRFTELEAQRREAQQRKVLPTAAERTARRAAWRRVGLIKPRDADCTKANIAGVLRKWKWYCHFNALGPWIDALKSVDRATCIDFLDQVCGKYNITSMGTSWQYFRGFKQLYVRHVGQHMDVNDSKAVLNVHDTILRDKYDLRHPNLRGSKNVADSNDTLVLLTFNIAYDTTVFRWERHRVINLPGCYIFLLCTGCRAAEIVDNERRDPKDGSWDEIYGLHRSTAIPSFDRALAAGHAPVPFDPSYLAAQFGAGEDAALQEELSDEEAKLINEMLSVETLQRGRPKALCYEDILLKVVRHPVTGKDVHVMAVRFMHHKGADNKPKPIIVFFTPPHRLIFCIINIIIVLAVHDNAFAARNLTTVRSVWEVKNIGPTQCTPLRWKSEWLKRPLFRNSDDEPMQYSKLRDDMSNQSLDAGQEEPMQPKDFRRGAANEANGDAPDAVRDQVLHHDRKWATFNNAYINKRVKYHLQNAVLHEPHEDALIEMMTHISVTRDPRAGRDIVPAHVWRELPPDPEIVELEQRRDALKGGQYRIRGQLNEEEIRRLTQLINRKKAQRKKEFKQQYRADYFYNRPTWDIEGQARGEEEEEYVEPDVDLQIPERAQLAKLLRHQPQVLSAAGLQERRIQIGELMLALCDKRETPRCKLARGRAQSEVSVKEESPAPDAFPLLMQKTQCPRCVGDERLPYETRVFPYCRPSVMNDHFDREHLEDLKDKEQRDRIFCDHPKCKEGEVKLKTLDHFRAHVMNVHGVELRPSDRTKSFPKSSRRVVPVFG